MNVKWPGPSRWSVTLQPFLKNTHHATALLGKVIIGEQHLPENKKIIKSDQSVGGQAGIPTSQPFIVC